ncbi:MAG: GGDEF domain-containing protein [Clostridia bacterium]|nr:GGDEF domain-containing protein [Clostridia bacterium]
MKNQKNQKIKKILYTAALIGTAILLFVSVVYFLSVIIHFRADLRETTESLSQQMAEDAAADIDIVLQAELARVDAMAEEILNAGPFWNEDAQKRVERQLQDYADNREHRAYIAANIRYYRNGVEFDSYGTEIPSTDNKSKSIRNSMESNTPVFSGIFEGNYGHGMVRSFVLWYPFAEEDEACIDGFLIYYLSDTFFASTAFYRENNIAEDETETAPQETEEKKQAFTNSAAFSCLISRHESEWNTWVIDLIGRNSTNDLEFSSPDQIFVKLTNLTHGAEGVKYLQSGLDQRETRVTTVSISATNYAIAVSPVPLTGGEIMIVEIYDPAVIYRTSYSFMGQMEGALIFLGVIFLTILIYLNYQRTHLREKKELEEQVDSVSGCLTYRYFLTHSEELVDKNPTNRYAVAMLRVNYLQYLGQLYGDEIFLKVIRFVGEVFEKLLDPPETYGYISDSNFAVLLHSQEEVELMNRLRMINAIIYNFPELKTKNNHVKVTFGIYLVRPEEEFSTLQCLEKAGMALRSTTFSVDSLFRFYNDELGADSNRQAEIELKMETSLQNDEFKVFYQPKYNLKKDMIDSAEALVRWYDPEKHRYYPPGDFIPLFEENGFIVKLDHYVFEAVCRFAADRIKNKQPLAPISINASRVTAGEPDFVRYYLSIKRKYDIPNNLLTIEFTESTAMDNYESLRKIVADLKAGGIGSSVDDFGSGFSSYSILKELKMDELKLDRFFITAGIDPERDDALLNSVIKLGQKLGMKVTQEGVESVEMMDRLRRAGCNTVQGYYYSRPITQDDFAAFLDKELASSETTDADK